MLTKCNIKNHFELKRIFTSFPYRYSHERKIKNSYWTKIFEIIFPIYKGDNIVMVIWLCILLHELISQMDIPSNFLFIHSEHKRQHFFEDALQMF